MQISYTVKLNIKHSKEFAGNQGNHQNFDPSLLAYKYWLMFMGIEQKNLKLLSCQYLLKKVSKQKFVAKIQDSYWLFVLGERDKHKDGEQLIEPKSWGWNDKVFFNSY